MSKFILDISNYDGNIDPSCLEENQVEGVIVGCQRPAIAREQIRELREHGTPIAGVYAFLYWGIDTSGQVAAAIAVAKENDISMVWLDCEDSDDASPNATPDSRISELHNCVAMVRGSGLVPGIYTGGPFWRSAMANTAAFKDLPLWFPSYFDDRRQIKAVNFGGWTQCAIHQWASDIPICGRNRDCNVLWDESLMEEDMAGTNELVRKLLEATNELARKLLEATYGSEEELDKRLTPDFAGVTLQGRVERIETESINQVYTALDDHNADAGAHPTRQCH